MIAAALWTLGLVICALGLVASLNSWRFARSVARDAQLLWRQPGAPAPFQPAAYDTLPPPVRRYLSLAGVGDGRPALQGARLTHGGTMTMAPGAPPVSIRGRQYLAADPPGFVWWGRVRVGPGMWIDARDKVIGGAGGMTVKVESTVTLQDVQGPELDQSALVRLLGELAWIPTAFRDPRYVRWQAIDADTARATLTVEGNEVSGLFHFGPDGMPDRFDGDRYRDMGPGKPPALTPFVGVYRDWREIGGVQVPFALEGSWMVDGRPYTFAHFRVEQVELDRPEPF